MAVVGKGFGMKGILATVVMGVVLLGGLGVQEGWTRPRWRFAVTRDKEAVGRLDVGVVRRDNTVFMVTAFYPGREALERPERKAKPSRRSYAELPEPGVLGKLKRWETLGRVEHYWMLFWLDGRVRVRHEKGVGGKADVREVGRGGDVVPLDPGQPLLAWLLVSPERASRTVTCASPAPAAFGQAKVTAAGSETVRGHDGTETPASRFEISGDCGSYTLWVDAQGEPVVLEAGGERYERFPR